MSNFSRMHDDYLDPDRYGLNDENWGEEFSGIEAAMKARDSGRWSWERITLCITGKDADLEAWGQQGAELVGVNEDGVQLVFHGCKTYAGTDVCLNTPEDMTDDEYDAAREAFLDAACECLPWGCEWDGDSWIASFRSDEITVPWVLNDNLEPDYERTADAIAHLTDGSNPDSPLHAWQLEVTECNEMHHKLAGWYDGDGNRCPPGKPSKAAAWVAQGEV